MARTAAAPRGQRYYVTVEYQNFGGQSQIPPMAAVGGELEFNKIAEEDAALAQGSEETARIVAADGSEIFSCDVGDERSDAVVKLNPVQITRGAPLRLNSFRLSMP
jgi:hypothetical protein